jgi:hypothetical protein
VTVDENGLLTVWDPCTAASVARFPTTTHPYARAPATRASAERADGFGSALKVCPAGPASPMLVPTEW